MTVPDFRADAAGILDDLVALRRALHADPELGLDLPRTQQEVLAALEGLPLEITTGTRTTSIVAVLRGALPGPTVLLRGDMDALPIDEATGLDYTSRNGAMHACGHDLHTAGLVGAAKLLAARRLRHPARPRGRRVEPAVRDGARTRRPRLAAAPDPRPRARGG